MKKPLLILLFSVIAFTLKAQNWGGGIDQQDFNWGFSFQYVASEYKIIRSPNWREAFRNTDPTEGQVGAQIITDPLKSIVSPLSAGFGIGFVVNYKLTPNVDLRSTPTLIFNDRIVNYTFEETGINPDFSEKEQRVQATMVDFPIGIKLKSERRKDFRAYLLLGAKYSMDLASGKKAKDETFVLKQKYLKNIKNFASYEAAIGFDLYFEYFKMSPELKVSHSFGNVIKRENHPYDTPIDKAILRSFTFSLFFE
jgi:hypothetical protein